MIEIIATIKVRKEYEEEVTVEVIRLTANEDLVSDYIPNAAAEAVRKAKAAVSA